MAKVQRIYPESKTALIHWIEQNFHDIQGYVATFEMKDGTTMTIHEVQGVIQAAGLSAVTSYKMKEVIDSMDDEG